MKKTNLLPCSVSMGDMLFLTMALVIVGLSSTVFAAEKSDIYQQDIPQMTTLECAKCHPQAFKSLRDSGGQHQLPCQDCHETFHTFKPGVPWEQRVPSCSHCHELPHGETVDVCLECHQDAHAPLASLVPAENMADLCSVCHQQQDSALAEGENAHGGIGCFDCHQGARHGVRPECLSCHDEPHTPYVDNAGCRACHPPHEPNRIIYDNSAPSAVCGGCHDDQQQRLNASEKKHKSLACAVCHAQKHGMTYDCRHCHGPGPHNPTLLENFSRCGDCHGDAHSLTLQN